MSYEKMVKMIVDIINDHEDRLSDGYKWYGGENAVLRLAENIVQKIEEAGK
jgi:hypothetical protein